MKGEKDSKNANKINYGGRGELLCVVLTKEKKRRKKEKEGNHRAILIRKKKKGRRKKEESQMRWYEWSCEPTKKGKKGALRRKKGRAGKIKSIIQQQLRG